MKHTGIILTCFIIAIASFAQNRPSFETRKNVPLDSIRLSDPFILADSTTKMYYMTGTGGRLWKSKDGNFDGKLLMAIHSHRSVNGRTVRIPHLFETDISGDKIVVGKRYFP